MLVIVLCWPLLPLRWSRAYNGHRSIIVIHAGDLQHILRRYPRRRDGLTSSTPTRAVQRKSKAMDGPASNFRVPSGFTHSDPAQRRDLRDANQYCAPVIPSPLRILRPPPTALYAFRPRNTVAACTARILRAAESPRLPLSPDKRFGHCHQLIAAGL